MDADAWQRTRHTVLVLREPPDHASELDPTPELTPDPSEPAARDRELARRAALVLRPPLLRAAGGAGDGGAVPPHQLLSVRWSDVEAVLESRLTGRCTTDRGQDADTLLGAVCASQRDCSFTKS